MDVIYSFKYIVFTLFSLWLLSACGVSNIDYAQNKLSFQVEQNQLMLDAQLLNKERINFRTLAIDRKVLALKEGNLVVYEDGNTDMSYEFARSTTNIMQVVFESGSLVKVYAKSNLYAFQLILNAGNVLNVMAQQDESQRLRFVYGMSTMQLNTMLKQLDPSARLAPYKNALTFNKPNEIYFAKWTTMNVDFLPLVKPFSTRSIW